MNLDSVSFLFNTPEMILLLRLLGCDNIRFPPQEDTIDTEAAMERLREDQLISGSRKALVVDQVIAFLLLAMDGAPFCLYASGDGYAAIFRTASASMILRKRGEQWLIAPFQTFADARKSLLDSLRRRKVPCSLTVCNRENVETLHFQTINAMIKAAQELLLVEEEEAKEKWKP